MTFRTWLPHSRIGKVLSRATDDPDFLEVRCFRDGKTRWYHEDSLQPHVLDVTMIDPDKPWEAYQ